MRLLKPAFAALALALTLAGCATVQRYGAASDVHALLIAIRDNDQAAFDARVDRPALKRQIETRLAAEARRQGAKGGWSVLGALAAQPLAELAGELLIQPRVFRAVADYYGYDAARPIPGPMAIASILRPLDDERVCAPRSKTGPCLLIFTREQGIWRLSGFEGDMSELRLKL